MKGKNVQLEIDNKSTVIRHIMIGYKIKVEKSWSRSGVEKIALKLHAEFSMS